MIRFCRDMSDRPVTAPSESATGFQPGLKLVMSTYSRNERYIDLCTEILAYHWPNHPELIVCTDRGNFNYSDSVIAREACWPSVLAVGIDQLIERGRLHRKDHVILLLEDHVPHAPIDDAAIRELSTFLAEHGDTYLNLSGYGAGDAIAVVGAHTVHLLHIHTFSSLHPAIWSVSHLRKTLAHARAHGITDPWAFERISLPDTTHYTTDKQIWPSAHGGFLWRGLVNVPSLRYMRKGPATKLRRLLLLKLLLESPRRLLARAAGLVK